MRLYAIVGWHHFAYMMISIALLGFGASGTALALARRSLCRPLPGRLRGLRRALRRHGDRRRRAGAAPALQPSRDRLGPIPAVLARSRLRRAGAAVLLRSHRARTRLQPLPTGDRPPLRLRPGRRRARGARCRRPALPAVAGGGAPLGRRPRLGGGGARPVVAGAAAPHARDRRGGGAGGALAAAGMDGAAPPHLRVQGSADGAEGSGRSDRGRAIEPARPDRRGREPDDPVPSCAGSIAHEPDRAARAARRLHRRQLPERHHPLRRRHRPPRLPRLHHRRRALPPAAGAEDADPRRRRRRAGAARPAAPGAEDRRRRGQPADRRAGARPLRRLRRRHLQPPRGRGPHRRSAQRGPAPRRALRPDPDPAALFLRGGGLGHAEPARELHLHRGGDGGLSRGARARRHPRRDPVAEAAAARQRQALRHRRGGAAPPGGSRSGQPGW